MQTLILGRPGAERARLERLLHEHGHEVSVCHERNWGCAGLDDACPLDGAPIDVAVAISEPSDRFDPQGIACMHRARIPLVTVGATINDRVLDYAVDNVAHVDEDILEILLAAAGDARGHRRAIKQSLAPHLRQGETMQVVVERRTDRVDVVLEGTVDERRATVLADVARAAARDHDPRVSRIDVSVTDQASSAPSASSARSAPSASSG